MLRDLHSDTSCRVRLGSSLSSSFSTQYGTQQGDPLAGLLFNIYMDHVVREAAVTAKREAASLGMQLGVQVRFSLPDTLPHLQPEQLVQRDQQLRSGRNEGSVELVQLLLADDLAAVASSAVALQLFMRHLEAACQRWGLVISGSKTECLAVDPRQHHQNGGDAASDASTATACSPKPACWCAALVTAAGTRAFSHRWQRCQMGTGSAPHVMQRLSPAAA